MTEIKGTDGKYAFTESGHVYNTRTNNRLTRQWSESRHVFKTRLYLDDGSRYVLYHDDLEVKPKSKLDTLKSELVPVEGYSRYSVTPYGAVWNMTNHRREPTLLQVYQIGVVDYVRVTSDEGKRHYRRVNDLVARAFPAVTA